MSTETSRDDFIIAIRSAFLKKGNRQKFSLFTLLVISILVLSLEYFKTGPVNQFRSITKDIIFRGSYVVSSPFKYVKDKTIQKEIKDNTNKLILLKEANGNFHEPGYQTIVNMEKLFKNNHQFMKRKQ